MPRDDVILDVEQPSEAYEIAYAPDDVSVWGTVPHTVGEAISGLAGIAGGAGTAVTAAAAISAQKIVVGDDGVRGVKNTNLTVTDANGTALLERVSHIEMDGYIRHNTGAVNLLVFLSAGGSAVNAVKITNHITGNAPIITVDGDADCSLTIQPLTGGILTLGLAGDIELGDGTERDMLPNTDGKVNLGTAAKQFNNGFLAGKLTATGGVRTAFSTDNVSDPPSDAEIDTAFGEPGTVGAGFIGIIDDNGGGVDGDVWLCVSTGSKWFTVGMTEAV